MSDLRQQIANLSPERRALLERLLMRQTAPVIAPRREPGSPVPLSFGQEQLWFLDQLEPGTPAYNLCVTVRLEGELDPSILRQCLQEIIRRHESLRTVFQANEGKPVQVVLPVLDLAVPVVNLLDLAECECSYRLATQLGAEAGRSFDLVAGPLLRATLYHLEPQVWLLGLTVHHLIADGWSMRVLAIELAALYQAFAAGRACPLDDLPVQYADYAVWQRQTLSSETAVESLVYWKERLQGLTPLDLPADHSRPPSRSYRGAQFPFELPGELTQNLRELGRQHEATLFMVLLAAFQALLGRYTGLEDVAVGSPVANRSCRELEPLIGFFVNTLVLRADLSGDPTFAHLLTQVRGTCLSAYNHAEMPFERLVEELQPQRDPSRHPLFQVLFSMQSSPPVAAAAGLRLELEEVHNATAKFDLSLYIREKVNGMVGYIEYSTDLFESDTIQRLAGHWETWLKGIAAQPGQPISQLPLLTAGEKEQLLRHWNATQVPLTFTPCLHQLVELQAEQTPETVAVIWNDRVLTYRELNQRANQLARHLRKLGVGTEVVVAISLERSPDLLVGLLGILKAGGAYLPLDPAYPTARLALMLMEAQSPVLVTQEKLLGRLPVAAAIICMDRDLDAISSEETTTLNVPVASGNLAYVLFTSGSTGRPKGVAVEHRSVVSFVDWGRRLCSQEEVAGVLASTSVGFDVSVFELFVPLTLGGSVILVDNILALSQLPAAAKVTLISTVPSALRELLRLGPLPDSVRTVHLAGEALSHSLVREVYEQGPVSKLFNLYGPTEATVYATEALIPRDSVSPPTIGRPIANTRVYVLDSHLQLVPVGVPGELYIAGAGLARGYLHRPDLTAERFLIDPYSQEPSARMYRTGDRVCWLSGGDLVYLGRLDHQVKLRGFRIELGEVEAALRRQLQVQEAVVVVREDQSGGPRLVAYVVAKPEQAPAADDLKMHLRGLLPDYMIPATFVFLRALPLSPNGKLDRKSLPIPAEDRETGGVAPRTKTEEQVAAIWQELLGTESVGVHDNFFDRGGHSLLAIQVVARLRAIFGLEVPVRLLFESATIAESAAWIDNHSRGNGHAALPPLRIADRTRHLPLSFAQQGLWFLEQWQPGSPVYHIGAAVRLRGPLEVGALDRSWQEVVSRHEVLRTTFGLAEEQPVQVISTDRTAPLGREDLSHLPRNERETTWQALAAGQARRQFDLTVGPLIRVHLVRLAPEEHVLLLTLHHIVSDRWSLGVIFRELSAFYEAFLSDREAALPALLVQYADYAAWQRGWLRDNALERQLTYWKETLQGLTALDLPTDLPRPAFQTFAGATRDFELPARLTRPLHDLARQHNATLYMVLLTAFQVLLGRYGGRQDVAVGSPVANRPGRELEPLIGFFVNTLVLRTDLSDDPTFADLLDRVRQGCLEAYAHQDVPFERLVEELQPQRDPGRNPIFQVLFAFDQGLSQPAELAGLEAATYRVDTGTSKFDFSLHMTEEGGILKGYVEYSTDLFLPNRIERFIGHWQTLLESICQNERQAITRLPLLTAAEHRQVLQGFNATTRPYPGPQLLHRLVEIQVERSPDATALVFRDATLTFAELDRRANRLAHYLIRHGATPEMPIALFMERSLELVVGLLACLKAGTAYLPLEPDHPPRRLALVLGEARPNLLLTQPHLLDLLPATDAHILSLQPGGAALESDESALLHEPSTSPVVAFGPESLAYVIYTSGSTGLPKGARNTHPGICNRLLWMQQEYGLGPNDTVLQKTPYGFDVSVWEFFWPLLTGARLILAEPGGHKDPGYLADLVAEERVTVLHFVPSMLRAFLQEPDLQLRCHTLREVICSGEALSGELAQRFFQALPQARLHNLYGPTEAAVDVTYWECDRGSKAVTVPIGRPVANTQMYVLDSHLELVPVGVPGELYIGGVQVALGYLGRPELSAERFVQDPWGGTGSRLYRTGDLGRWGSDGVLEYLGRLDGQVKLRGQRIELGEVEAALLAHPGVREAAVVVCEDNPGEPRLVGYVVNRAGQVPSAVELRSELRQRLPEAMVPAAFVFLDGLPLSANGKLDRKALPVPEQRSATEGETVPPRTAMEAEVAAVWREVLGRDTVGVHDNFFDLGGHSLLATQVISRVKAVFATDIGLQSFFERPTIAALAERVELSRGKELARDLPPLVPRSNGEPVLSFAQQRLWFLDQWQPGSPIYNIPAARRLKGPLDFAALESSIQKIIDRHEVLRTTFRIVGGQPVAVVHRNLRLPIAFQDLTAFTSEEREAAAEPLLREEARRPFDLTRGPLIRVSVFRLADEDHLVLVCFSHIVADGWSIGIFHRELSELYQSEIHARLAELPELPVQYADYAIWQRQWLQGKVLDEQRDYWKAKLQDLTSLELPADRQRPAVPTYTGANRNFRLEPPLVLGVRQLARNKGCTPFMVLLAAFQALLGRRGGCEDVAVGSPVANRQRIETEALIGFFVNTLVLRTDLSGDPSFAELLARVRATCLEAYANQDVPFERLVEDLQPQRDPGRNPLFQVLFVLQNAPTAELHLKGIQLTPLEIDTGTCKFDLSLRLTETKEGAIIGVLEYNTDLFEMDTVSRLAGHYATLLSGAVAEPLTPLSRLPLLTATERRQVLHDFNATACSYPGPQLLHRLIEHQVERSPEATALTLRDTSLSYADLDRRANRLAHYLIHRGASADIPIAIFMERSLELVVGLLACLKAGAAYLPLEPDHPTRRLALVLDEARPNLLLTQPHLLHRLPTTNARVLTLKPGGTALEGDESALVHEPSLSPTLTFGPESLAYIIYTSGSTGLPKGAMNTHLGICNRLLWMQQEYGLRPGDNVLQKTPYGFDVSVWEFFWPLLAGSRLVLAEPGGHKDPAYLADLVDSERITVMHFVPSMLRAFLLEPGLGRRCHTLRDVICSGEALAGELAERFFQALPQARLHNLYGPTEAAVDVTYWECERNSKAVAVPIGRPVANTQMYVLDSHLEPVPVGVPGELYIGGVQVALGYLGRPELSAERFVASRWCGPGSRLYRTGDLGRWRSDGVLEYLGRLDGQVKLRGQRIELGEVEAALLAHPGVREAAAAVREDSPGEPRLVGYVVGQAGQLPSAAELRGELRQRLPEGMVPAVLVFLDGLPLSANGKLDRRALPAPDRLSTGEGEMVAPRTAMEAEVATVWREVLGRDTVGVHDNFFDLGGHSLLATQVISRLRQNFQVDLPLRRLFEAPTVANLALLIGEQQARLPGMVIHRLSAEDEDRFQAEIDLLGEEEVDSLLQRALAEQETK